MSFFGFFFFFFNDTATTEIYTDTLFPYTTLFRSKAEPDSIDPRPHARLEGQIDTGVAVEGPDGRSVDADRQAFARLAAVDVKLAAADGARFGGRDGRGGRSLPGPRSRNGEREQDDRTWKSKYRLHGNPPRLRSEEHTSELQSLMRISYAVFCLKKKKNIQQENKMKTLN